jgi:hypothetical protein
MVPEILHSKKATVCLYLKNCELLLSCQNMEAMPKILADISQMLSELLNDKMLILLPDFFED